MWIVVKDYANGEVVFEGDAEVFLEANDYDEEIVEALNDLDFLKVGASVRIYGNAGDVYVATKSEEEEEEE